MPSRPNHRRPKNPRRRRKTPKSLWPFLRTRWRDAKKITKAILASPPVLRMVLISSSLLFLWLGVNWAYQTFNKPTEVLFPLDHSLDKNPSQTWKQYGALFCEHATPVVTAELLAALAQVEGGGNPLARTYWRWRFSWNPLEWYHPASTAVGMFQITDGTFQDATRYCIHDHVVAEAGSWLNLQSCWLNGLYSRIIPSHAIEMTAALLDRRVAQAIEARRVGSVTSQRKQDLATVIHLCGAGAGQAYALRGFRLQPYQRCGDHDVQSYLTRINVLKQQFAKLKG